MGSASNKRNRIGQHQDFLLGNRSADGVNKLLLKAYPISDITWSMVQNYINYSKLALINLPPHYEQRSGEYKILRALTEFVPRVLEQSLITFREPFYKSKGSFYVWDSGLLDVYSYAADGSVPVRNLNATTYYEIDKVVKIAQASDILKERRNLVNRYQHSIDGFESRVFNCRVTVGGFGMEQKVSKRN